jgi:hypothetical protein
MDDLVPLRPGEQVVVVAIRDRPRFPPVRRDLAAECLRGVGLTGTGDVVSSTLDRAQRRPRDILQADVMRADLPGSLGKQVFLKRYPDRVQKVVFSHVQYRGIFVQPSQTADTPPCIARPQACPIAGFERPLTVRVRGDDRCMLDEAWIDAASGAAVGQRNRVDHCGAKPVEAKALSKPVDRGRIQTRVDGAAHQRQTMWGNIASARR